MKWSFCLEIDPKPKGVFMVLAADDTTTKLQTFDHSGRCAKHYHSSGGSSRLGEDGEDIKGVKRRLWASGTSELGTQAPSTNPRTRRATDGQTTSRPLRLTNRCGVIVLQPV